MTSRTKPQMYSRWQAEKLVYGSPGPEYDAWLQGGIDRFSDAEREEYEADYPERVALTRARKAMEDAKAANTAVWRRARDADKESRAAELAYKESRKRVSETRAVLTEVEQRRARLF